eukprot:COSAG02_NODE_2009_length_10124_cov_15.733566_4_plen_121_part_00
MRSGSQSQRQGGREQRVAAAARLEDVLSLLPQLQAAHEGVARLAAGDLLDLHDLRFGEAFDVQHRLRSCVLDVGDGVQAEVLQLLDVGRGDALVREHADLEPRGSSQCQRTSECVTATVR